MYYDCDLDVIKTSFLVPSVPRLFADISKEAAGIWQNTNLFQNVDDALTISDQKNEFVANNETLLCNTMVTGIERPVHMLYKLAEPYRYKHGTEHHDIRIIFVLLSPKEDGPFHLRRLSRISRLLQNQEFYERISQIDDRDTLRGQFMYPDLEEKAA